MEAELKKTLKAVTLELRHLLEGRYDGDGRWKPGDLEQRLAAIGVRRDRASAPVDELGHLTDEDRQGRRIVDAYLKLREEAGVVRSEAVAEFVRETAYTWANRLLALRCMEARDLIDPVILQQEAYGGRSLEHHRLAQRQPELCAGEDDGLFAVLDKVFQQQTERLPMLFDPQAPGIALRPSPAALKDCLGLLSLNPDTLRKKGLGARIQGPAEGGSSTQPLAPNPFIAPDALGWAYQYWNTEEKDRVFAKVRTVKGAKIAGADIIPATQLYTESYMVKFLVQNSLGAAWMGMHPESKLAENWEYYVKDADRTPVGKKPVCEITFLDPACGSGHFLLEALELLYAMYVEEGKLTEPAEICDAIMTKNLFGIDIDPRSVQIADAALWMKAAEQAFDYAGAATNLVAATASHLKGQAWQEFLASFEREPSVARVLRKFAETMEHIDQIGSLARPAEDLREIIREEHATWERQVREQREANFLFPEFREQALRGQLPFHEISDEEFGDRLFYRAKAGIDAFTERARESGEFEDQMLGSETRAGFRLVDLLNRHYDVVAANPPYMGSKNMGPALKKYVERNFKAGKRDLYAAFILRNLELAGDGGRVAMVTQQSWMFLSSFADLRAIEEEKLKILGEGEFRGLLLNTAVETLAHLGPNAFADIGGEVVNTALFTLDAVPPSCAHRLTAFRLTGPKSPEEKDCLLRLALTAPVHSAKSRPLQCRLVAIPQSPLCYWLRDRFFDALQSPLRLDSFAKVRQGLATTDNSRFTRCFWEVSHLGNVVDGKAMGRWFKYAKGGRYQKWSGLEWLVVDWRHDGAAIKQQVLRGPGTTHWSRRVANYEYYFQPGLTYTQMSRGSMGTRLLTDSIFDVKGMSVFLEEGVYSLDSLSAFLSTHVVSYLLRVVTQNLEFHAGYVAGMPLPKDEMPDLTEFGEACRRLKDRLISSHLDEYAFHPSRVATDEFNWQEQAALLCVEGYCEKQVSAAYELDNEDVCSVMDETGVPAAWLPLIVGFDRLPDLPQQTAILPRDVADWLARQERMAIDDTRLGELCRSLRSAFECGPGEASVEEQSEQNDERTDDDEGAVVGARIPIPSELFLEELSQKCRAHPVSVFSFLKEGIEREGWRCLPEESRLWADRITVTVLRLLGYRWPKQIEAGELVPDWADPDGIIPLTPLANDSTLFERVEQRLRVDEIDASDFVEIKGKPLDAWLATEFFKHHTKQFKKRPIAWQLQSGTRRSGSGVRKKGKAPVFACLLYYQKLDADTLPKIRSQYVGPLRQRLETELRGILAVVAEGRSDRQEKRRVELDDAILELTAFDAKLGQVAREGFAYSGLSKLLADEPLDGWCSLDGKRPRPTTTAELIVQESSYAPDINDGVRVNIAPLQKAGLLAADVLAKKDLDKAIADRAQWRADERRWVRDGKLPQPGWWPEPQVAAPAITLPPIERVPFQQPGQYPVLVLLAMLQQSGGTTSLIRLARAYSLLATSQVLANTAPPEVSATAREWAAKYTESPEIGFFRDAIMDLVQRNQVDGMALRSGRASLVGTGSNLAMDDWVTADAALALAVLDGMPSVNDLDVLPDRISSQVRDLLAG